MYKNQRARSSLAIRAMENKIKIALFLAFVVIAATFMSTVVYVQEVGQAAPDFTMTDIDGNVFKLSDYHGRIVILDFFIISWRARRDGISFRGE